MGRATKFIFDTFIKLTSMTYPYGHEDKLVRSMIKQRIFPREIVKDVHGNFFYQVGESRTIFASHLDTVSKEYTNVSHVIEGKMIKTDGTTTLGADDKAGVTTMLWMIKNNVPGLYYFFIGEEVGCIGSGKAASSVSDFKGKYDRIISFDRRDVGSIITHQSWSRCCSDSFGDALAAELNKSGMSYKKDDGGVYTDSAEFVDIIPECTNVSVGYYKEHTTSESQDIEHLEKLAEACLKVDWENLPTERDPNAPERKSSSSSSSYYDAIENGYEAYGRGKRKSRKGGSRGNGYGSGYGKDYGYHSDWYDTDDYKRYNDAPGWDDEDSGYSEHEELGSKIGKSYYDNGSELVEITPKSAAGQSDYEWIMSKFVGSKLTIHELEVIKNQYLDVSIENDKLFYDYLVEYISELNQ